MQHDEVFVDDKSQLHKDQGRHLIQGYLTGRRMTASAFWMCLGVHANTSTVAMFF